MRSPKKSNFALNVLFRIGGYLANGLIIVTPLIVSVWLLIWFFNLVDRLLAPVLIWGFGRVVPGMGFAFTLELVITIGLLGAVIGHRKFLEHIEVLIVKIPVVGAVYGGTREFLNSFTATNTARFLEVVLMEFPRKGIYTVGIVTGVAKDKDGKRVLNVFIPTAPTPMGGFLQIVPESEVIHCSMSVSEAMKLIVTIGMVSRADIADMLTQVPGAEKKNVARN